MKYTGIALLVFLKILQIENRMRPFNYVTIDPNRGSSRSTPLDTQTSSEEDINENEKVIGLTTNDNRDEEYQYDFEPKPPKKPCAIVVLSNVQHPKMQSLLRRYRYDSNGVLIPSSVKYFIKLPRGLRDSPVLVPLTDKAFSPLGGFVRYYKEVPPIPHSW